MTNDGQRCVDRNGRLKQQHGRRKLKQLRREQRTERRSEKTDGADEGAWEVMAMATATTAAEVEAMGA